MDLDKVFGTDVNLEEDGVWVNIDDDSSIKVARLGNKAFKKMSSKFNKQNKIVARHTNDIPDDLLIKIVAKTILLDWKNIIYKGKEIKYSEENAIKMLSEYKDFLNLVIELANEKETFRRQDIEEAKDNLGKS